MFCSAAKIESFRNTVRTNYSHRPLMFTPHIHYYILLHFHIHAVSVFTWETPP